MFDRCCDPTAVPVPHLRGGINQHAGARHRVVHPDWVRTGHQRNERANPALESTADKGTALSAGDVGQLLLFHLEPFAELRNKSR